MQEQLSKILADNKLLKNVDFTKINLSGLKGKLITLSEGEILYREGDSADIIYLVVSGEINVIKKKLLGKSKSYIFNAQDFFGQDEFFEETSRTSTAVALKDTYLIALTKEEVDELIKQDDEIYVNLREQNAEINLEELDSKPAQEPLVSVNNKKSSYTKTPEITSETNTEESSSIFSLDFNQQSKDLSLDGDESSIDKNLVDNNTNEKQENISFNESETKKLNESNEQKSKKTADEENISSFTKTIVEESNDLNDALFKILSTQETNAYSNGSQNEHEDLQSEQNLDNSLEEQSVEISQEKSTEERNNDIIGTEGQNLEELAIAEEDVKENKEDKLIKDEVVLSQLDSEISIGGEEENDLEDGKLNLKERKKDLSATEIEIIKEVDEKLAWIEKSTQKQRKETNIDGNAIKIEQLKMIIAAAESINSTIKIDEVLQKIVDVACNLTSAERGTLYLVDKEKNEIWSKIAIGSETHEIRLKIGEGLAGHVAKTGELINSKNVHNDPRFNSAFDKLSGYTTQNMICFPIKNKQGEIIGVLQLLNSSRGEFSKLDEEFLEALSIHSAIAIQNAELVEKLLQLERNQTLGKMANFLIQDIKKPILVSKRYAEHLASRNQSPELKQVIDMLLEQLSQVTDLVQTISSYAIGKAILRTTTVSLNKTLDDFATRISSFVQSHNCSIESHYDKDVLVKLDSKEFFLCYNHIIKNACDAMPDSGIIAISTKREGKNVKIIFKDQGLGIPNGFKDKIFEPFISHGKKEGTGLGLTITKKIVEAHNGTIEIDSTIGEGTTVTITLPIASIY
ncbi:ATP-binding protein [Melioribacteraceae bacterium 4301-Me]|uniref:ATP-binding protein n=1 Tax=Pyranulibacter aquaticus TaxID=3163344 RepID=UPI00359B3285